MKSLIPVILISFGLYTLQKGGSRKSYFRNKFEEEHISPLTPLYMKSTQSKTKRINKKPQYFTFSEEHIEMERKRQGQEMQNNMKSFKERQREKANKKSFKERQREKLTKKDIQNRIKQLQSRLKQK